MAGRPPFPRPVSKLGNPSLTLAGFFCRRCEGLGGEGRSRVSRYPRSGPARQKSRPFRRESSPALSRSRPPSSQFGASLEACRLACGQGGLFRIPLLDGKARIPSDSLSSFPHPSPPSDYNSPFRQEGSEAGPCPCRLHPPAGRRETPVSLVGRPAAVVRLLEGHAVSASASEPASVLVDILVRLFFPHLSHRTQFSSRRVRKIAGGNFAFLASIRRRLLIPRRPAFSSLVSNTPPCWLHRRGKRLVRFPVSLKFLSGFPPLSSSSLSVLFRCHRPSSKPCSEATTCLADDPAPTLISRR